jgi:hypothetical protein
MSDKEFLTQLVQEKVDRQAELRGLKRNLEELDGSLLASRFGRFFGSSYWFIKRWVTVGLALALIVLGALFIFSPTSVMQEGDRVFDHIFIEYKKSFLMGFGQPAIELAYEAIAMESPTNQELIDLFNDKAESYLTAKMQLHMAWFGLFLIFVSFLMLYISRQARKVKLRNSKLNEAEKLTQELSESFRQVIDNEEKELDRLKELLTRL